MKMKLSKEIATAFYVSIFLLLLLFSGAWAEEIELRKESKEVEEWGI